MSAALILDTAKEAAIQAGKLLLQNYGKLRSSQISQKSKNDFVTEIDKRSEKIILSAILKRFPDHGILAEEGGRAEGKRYRWIIDPLDGTSNYIHQFPLFSVSIGILEEDRYLAGVVYDPLHKEMFWARRGAGAYLNKKRIHVSPTPKLATSLMATGIPFRARNRFDEYMDSLKRISLASAGMRRGGSAALDLAYVACGRFEGFWEINLSPWDIAAGAHIVEEAGGRMSDMWGQNSYLFGGDVLASNKLIHGEIKAITSTAFSKKTDAA
jgi:myo-inositol-1(or 4)-monophosphatase